jgi:hypothetical protein
MADCCTEPWYESLNSLRRRKQGHGETERRVGSTLVMTVSTLNVLNVQSNLGFFLMARDKPYVYLPLFRRFLFEGPFIRKVCVHYVCNLFNIH